MVRYHHGIAAAVTLTLALATAAPASAKAGLRPTAGAAHLSTPASTNLCSEVCSGSGYAAAQTSSNGPRSEVVSGGGYGQPTAPATVVRVVSASDGFDWGDAGIGAGGALALMTLLVGGTLGATNIRRRATRRTA